MISFINEALGLSGNRRDSERGVTLMELIVAMGIFAVLSTLIILALTSFNRAFTRDSAATASTSTAAVGMNELTRIIRAGSALPKPGVVQNNPVFERADRENMILVSYVADDVENLKPVRVQFQVDPAERVLTETRWSAIPHSAAFPSFWVFEPNPQSSRVIARTIAVPDSGDDYLFSYFSIGTDGTEQEVTIPPGGIVDASVLARIAVVKVSLTVQADEHERAEPVTVTNRVGIPNLGIPRVGGV